MRHYHRVYAEISLDNIVENFNVIKERIHHKKVCAVIKADGYGHGAVPIAKELEFQGIDQFAVAVSHEAVMLRRYGIKTPILVLGYTSFENYEDLIKYDITQTVFKLEMAREISEVATRLQKPAKIHLKIDTGMGRIGFLANNETIDSIKTISQLPFIHLEGIFTHFAKADEADLSYTHQQLEAFNHMIEKLTHQDIHFEVIHASNSAGMMEVEGAHFDMVRVGIAMFGLYPSHEVRKSQLLLKPALTLHSNIIMLKEVGAGSHISYGGTYVTTRPTKVATIPVGYGDGYSRQLSSKGRVIIRGQYAPIIGRVCMDQFMVDVTDIPEVEDSDDVILIGEEGQARITVEEIAEIMETINYEVVCLLSKRIPRVYLKANQPVYSVDYF